IAMLVLLVVLTCSVPVSAFAQYSRVHAEAEAGVAHLKRVQTLLAPFLKQPGIPDAGTLQTVQRELTAAERNFAQTRRDLGSGMFSLAGSVPLAHGTLTSVAVLASAADEGCLAGLDLLDAANVVLPLLKGGFFAESPPAAGTASTPGS